MMDTTDFKWHEANTPEELKAFYLSILDKLRAVAKEHGYALGLHGSLRRDFDLIAAPWVAQHSDKDVLARALMIAACGISSDRFIWEKKPCGRLATAFPICWSELRLPSSGHIDLSVLPGVVS